jgi:putative FmdB family regulatory protein
MPIYEYRCPLCEREVEKLQRMSEPPPKCDGVGSDDEKLHDPVPMKKIVSASSFALKGGGWAKDGYS